jgi:hypothetical protein
MDMSFQELETVSNRLYTSLLHSLPIFYQYNLKLSIRLVYIVYITYRSCGTPPEPLMVVFECAAIIWGYKEFNWEVAKGMMTDPNFIRRLQETDCDLITGTQFRAIRAHMKVM